MDKKIQNCDIRWKFRCPKNWDKLTETDDSSVKLCQHCKKLVYRCTTLDALNAHASEGHCVALIEDGHFVIGEVGLDYRPDEPDQ